MLAVDVVEEVVLAGLVVAVVVELVNELGRALEEVDAVVVVLGRVLALVVVELGLGATEEVLELVVDGLEAKAEVEVAEGAVEVVVFVAVFVAVFSSVLASITSSTTGSSTFFFFGLIFGSGMPFFCGAAGFLLKGSFGVRKSLLGVVII